MRFSRFCVLSILLLGSFTSLAGAAENVPAPDAIPPVQPQVAPQAVVVETVQKEKVPVPAARLGYVDVAKIGAESETGKSGMAQITELKEKFRTQIEAKRKQLDKQKDAIEAKLKTLTAAQREAKAKEFQKKIEEFQKFGMNAEKEFMAKQEEFSGKLYKAVEQASAELAKAKGLALVVIKKEMLYLGSGVDAQDVTDEVIKKIDRK